MPFTLTGIYFVSEKDWKPAPPPALLYMVLPVKVQTPFTSSWTISVIQLFKTSSSNSAYFFETFKVNLNSSSTACTLPLISPV